ncbi:hypothetical protein MAR_032399 [Mya arenaria]|uniref:Uncharacterized protein n=1 Tax=Mya arenaria TaxID=6604 RepID=A0ABY7F6N8_MYAAR|nr:hypothetical protein MAR_032399 [Mya arenaria]
MEKIKNENRYVSPGYSDMISSPYSVKRLMGDVKETCVICKTIFKDDDLKAKLGTKGSDGINRASADRADSLITYPGESVHIDCRKKYCNPINIKYDKKSKDELSSPPRELRSCNELFSFKEHCLFCGKTAKLCGRKRGPDVYPVRTLDFQLQINSICTKRADEWANTIRSRLKTVNDLPAADALYHQTCSVNFRTMKAMPATYLQDSSAEKRFRGRPVSLNTQSAFHSVIKYLEDNDNEQITMTDLAAKMKETCGDEAFGTVHLKQKLREYFGDSIIITDLSGKRNVVTLRHTASSILHDFYKQQDNNGSEEKKRSIIETAAKLIRSDIKALDSNKSEYPSPTDISSTEKNIEYLPESLRILLQAILSYYTSYTATCHHTTSSARFRDPYVADNVDHNIRTIDGHGTFHGMGIIACVTPATSSIVPIQRRTVGKEDICKAGEIRMSYYKPNEQIKKSMTYAEIQQTKSIDNTLKLDLLVKVTAPIRPHRPVWSGLMQMLQKGEYPGKASVIFMPMIDLDPGDLSCIYTTLLFVENHATRYAVTPILTFDQPLYWKAFNVILNEAADSPLHKVVLRLGGFHTIMSFLGSIGHLMQGSGLNEVLETVYASNAVMHIATGKAVARGIRGHLLVENALMSILVSEVFGLNISECSTNENNSTHGEDNEDERLQLKDDNTPLPDSMIGDIGKLYDDFTDGKSNMSDITQSELLDNACTKLDETKDEMRKFRTAALWLQYMEMVHILQSFVKAERTGDWLLHLDTVSRMLPYFAAAGHNLYLKSAYVYLQTMQTLEKTNTDVSPFTRDSKLRNIETGVEADSSVDVENSSEIGNKVIASMAGKCVLDHTFKKKQQAVVLTTKPLVKLSGDETIQVDPQLLFQRLITVALRQDDDISHYFEYELSSVPSTLFDACGFPKQPQKATLADAIWSLGNCSGEESDHQQYQYVLDGESLIHRLPWTQGATFADICNAYTEYISKQYNQPIVVFDGYMAGPSIKDVAHIRRSHGVTSTNVDFKGTTPFRGKKDKFLSNPENKQRFINLLGTHLSQHDCTVLHAPDDADVLIVKTTIECSETCKTVLIGEDTDLLVLLCFYASHDSFNILFRSGSKKHAGKSFKTWDIQKTQELIGDNVCKMLPFIHAYTGCDSTSKIQGIGKGAALKRFKTDSQMLTYAKVFNAKSDKSEVQKAGENVMVALFGGHETEGLDLLRFRKFARKVAIGTTCVQVHSIPPTSAAVKFHSLRVYYQVQCWTTDADDMLPTDWGWHVRNQMLYPIKTDISSAPESLLKIIKCNCKSNCDSKRCTCRKHGLDCWLWGMQGHSVFKCTQPDRTGYGG